MTCPLDNSCYCAGCHERYCARELAIYVSNKRSIVPFPGATTREVQSFPKTKGRLDLSKPRFAAQLVSQVDAPILGDNVGQGQDYSQMGHHPTVASEQESPHIDRSAPRQEPETPQFDFQSPLAHASIAQNELQRSVDVFLAGNQLEVFQKALKEGEMIQRDMCWTNELRREKEDKIREMDQSIQDLKQQLDTEREAFCQERESLKKRIDHHENRFMHQKLLVEQSTAKGTIMEERMEKVDNWLDEIETNSRAVQDMEDTNVDLVDRARQFLGGYL